MQPALFSLPRYQYCIAVVIRGSRRCYDILSWFPSLLTYAMEPERPPTPLGHPDRIPTPPGQTRFPTPRGYRRIRDCFHTSGYQQFCWHGPIGYHPYPGNRLLIPGHNNLHSIKSITEPCEPLNLKREREKTPEQQNMSKEYPKTTPGCEAEKAMIELLQRRVEELQADVVTGTNTIARLRQQKANLTNLNTTLQANIAAGVTEIAELEEQTESLNATIANLQNEVDTYTTSSDDLTPQVNRLSQEVTNLRAQVVALTPPAFVPYPYPPGTVLRNGLVGLPEAGQVPNSSTPAAWVRVPGFDPGLCQSGLKANRNEQCRIQKNSRFAYCTRHCNHGPWL